MSTSKNPQIPLLRLPIFWLFLGPPILRFYTHSPSASLEGSFDAWNILRFAWWLLFGLVALLELYRFRSKLGRFIRSLGAFPWWVGIWLVALIASTINSPAPAFTFANALLMTILVLAALDFGFKLHSGMISTQRALRICLGFSVVLLTIFLLALILTPELVSKGSFGGRYGLRARGGHIADNALLSQVVFFISLYLASHSTSLTRGFYRFLIFISPLFLLVAQTRAMYVTFIIGCTIYLLGWLQASQNHQRTLALGMVCLGMSSIFGLALYDELPGSTGILARAEAYLVRDRDSIEGMSGRDVIASVVLEAVFAQPLGLGHSAGPRVLLLNSEELLNHHIYGIGNAHNMYIEVLAGSGFLGFITWLALLLWLLWRVWRIRGKEVIPIRVLFIVVLIGGLTESPAVFPFNQTSVLLWILVALIINLNKKGSPHDYPQKGGPQEATHAYRHF